VSDKYIARLLQQSDKAELLEWLQERLPSAEKCLIATADPDDEGGLVIHCCQIGHQYLYELAGFADWVARFILAQESGNEEDE